MASGGCSKTGFASPRPSIQAARSSPGSSEQMTTLDEFFAGRAEARQLFDTLLGAVDILRTTELHVTKSQIAFRRRKVFAWVWIPGRYLRGQTAPLVLTLALRQRDVSPRWKEIVEPSPGRFTHHLELYTAADIDAEVQRWLHEAWMAAGFHPGAVLLLVCPGRPLRRISVRARRGRPAGGAAVRRRAIQPLLVGGTGGGAGPRPALARCCCPASFSWASPWSTG